MSTQKSTQPADQPSPARRALLTGGAVGLAALAGTTLGGAQPASAGTATVAQITPTDDTTGSQDTAAINSALSSGFAWLGAGTFYINAVISIPHKAALWGVGAETRVMCVGAAGFYMHDTASGDGSDRTKNSSGSIRDLIIDGTNASAGAIGLDIGDGWGYRLDHVFVENFTGTNSIGFRIGNDFYFTEKMRGTSLHARNCTTLVYMDSTVTSDVSHGYNDLEFYISLNPGQMSAGQNGFTFDKGVNYYGGSLVVRGNQYTTTASTGAWFFGVINSNGAGNYSRIHECYLDIRVEGDGGNSFSPTRLHVNNSQNGIFDCWGRFTMSGAGGAPDATSGQFQLSGVVPSNTMVPIRTEAPDWQPQPAIAAPAIPGSGTAITNSTGCNVMVYLNGGTLTAATQVNGTAVGSSSTTQYYLPQGQTIKLTYSVSPTSWQWQPVS